MATVGGVFCDLVFGVAGDLQLRVDTWQVPGIEGVGYHTLGKGGVRFGFTLFRFGTSAEVNTWRAAIEALVGGEHTIVDDWGDSHTNMLIQSASQVNKEGRKGQVVARGEIRIGTVKSQT